MKLYLISQDVNGNFYSYNGFVVCANDEEDAKTIHALDKDGRDWKLWVSKPEDIKVKYLGEADKGIDRGEILADFEGC